MRPPSDQLDLVWLSGLLEGEGTFILHLKRYAFLSVSSIDKDVIDRVASIWGASVVSSLLASYKTIYKTSLCGRQAIPWLKALHPLMGTRRKQQISKILSVYNMEIEDEAA